MQINEENYYKITPYYIHKMWKNYIEKNEPEYKEFAALQKRKNELLEMHLQFTKERHAAYPRKVRKFFGDFIEAYDSSKQFEKVQDLISGKFNGFSVSAGKNGSSLSKTAGQIANIAKTETDLNKLVKIATEYMEQLETKLNMVQKTLIPHLEAVAVDAFLNGEKEETDLIKKAKQFVGVDNTIIYGGTQSEHQKVNGIVSYCLQLIKSVNSGLVDQKFKSKIDELFPLIADKISNLMITLEGSMEEICADFMLTYFRALMIKETGQGLTNLNHGIVGQARYTPVGGLVHLDTVSQVSPKSDSLEKFKDAVYDINKAENGINTSKADVMATIDLNQCTFFLPMSVKHVTLKEGQRSARVDFQKVSFQEGLLRLVYKLDLNLDAYRKFIYNTLASSSGLSDKKKEADSIRVMIGTASLLTAIVGIYGTGTQNILGVMINKRIFHLQDFLRRIIDGEFGPSYYMQPSLRHSYIKNTNVNAKDYNNNIYAAAVKRSEDVRERAEAYLASVKIDIGVRIAAKYLQ